MQISVNLKFLLKSLSHYCRCFLHPLVLDTNILQRGMRDNGQTYHKWSVGAELVSLVCDPHNTILGAVYTVSFFNVSPFLLARGGSKF